MQKRNCLAIGSTCSCNAHNPQQDWHEVTGRIVLAIVLLIAPAAIHRLAFDGIDDPKLHLLGSRIITIALLPLASAIACDMGVALFKLFGNASIATVGAILAGMLLIGLWYLLPLAVRRGLRHSNLPRPD